MDTLKSLKCYLHTFGLLGLSYSALFAGQKTVSPTTAKPVKVETLQFANVDALHNYNLLAFEQVRNAFGASRMIQVYRNPVRHQNLIVGKHPVKSISLVSNALSKSLDVNTLELQKLPKPFEYPSQAHPSFLVSFDTNAKQQGIYQRLSKERPMAVEGSKVWAAMFAKQQCLKCHETYKLGSVIGAFVYELEGVESLPKELPEELKEDEPKVLKEVASTLVSLNHVIPLIDG